MKILFVIEKACKKNDSNSNIADVIMDYLKKNHQVYVVTQNTTRNEKLKIAKKDNIIYYFYLSAYEQQLKIMGKDKEKLKEFETNKGIFFIKHPVFALKRMVYAIHEKSNFKFMISRVIKKVCKTHNIDVAIAVTLPYFTASSLAKAKVKAKKIIYQLDPYSQNYYFKDDPKAEKIEKDTLECIDRIITSDLIYEENLTNNLRKYIGKFKTVEYPNVRELSNSKSKNKISFLSGKINCCFVGNFYSQIRNPKYLFEVFSSLKDTDIVLHIIGDMYDGKLEDFKSYTANNIIFHGRKSLETAIDCMRRADILVSINNTIANQVPGKIFDYISTGKPIINICKRQDCPSLKYMRKYPLGINIIEGDNKTEVSGKIQEFCEKNKGEQIDFSVIKELYKENTIEEVGKQFEFYLR